MFFISQSLRLCIPWFSLSILVKCLKEMFSQVPKAYGFHELECLRDNICVPLSTTPQHVESERTDKQDNLEKSHHEGPLYCGCHDGVRLVRDRVRNPFRVEDHVVVVSC